MRDKHYFHTTRAWHWEATRNRMYPEAWVDEIMFVTQEPFGEMAMRWYIIDNESIPVLEVCVESALTLSLLPDVLSELASWHGKSIGMTPTVFRGILELCGFIDKTSYKREDSYPPQKGE